LARVLARETAIILWQSPAKLPSVMGSDGVPGMGHKWRGSHEEPLESLVYGRKKRESVNYMLVKSAHSSMRVRPRTISRLSTKFL
jgi:hypothetical protein